MPYLTAPSARGAKQTYRYFVEVASCELDFEGLSMHYQIIDVVVLEPTEKAIKTLIASAKWLQGYTLVSFWQPEPGSDEDAPF